MGADRDQEWMMRALELARRAWGETHPLRARDRLLAAQRREGGVPPAEPDHRRRRPEEGPYVP